MRPSAFIPVVFTTGALILAFLCVFAGHKRDFLEEYDIITLNTSRIGTNLLDENDSPFRGSNPLTNWINNKTQDLTEEINEAFGSLAERVGVEDFYSVHILNYCWGTYTPGPLPNGTFDKDDIDRNVTACSPMQAMFFFDPDGALNQSLQENGVNITLPDLEWPEDIERGVDALRAIMKAIFVLYCISIVFTFLALVGSIIGIFAIGRLTAAVNLMIALLAFLSLGIVSALVTAFSVKGSDVINKYGEEVGVEAHRGYKLMALTWAATGAMLLAAVIWSVSCVVGHRRRAPAGYAVKSG